jgi:hypothetical protein
VYESVPNLHLERHKATHDGVTCNDVVSRRLPTTRDDSICRGGLNESIDTTTANGRCFFKVMAVPAEFERDLIRERTLARLAAALGRGRKAGMFDAEPFQPCEKRRLDVVAHVGRIVGAGDGEGASSERAV